jgi:hypothetical protein
MQSAVTSRYFYATHRDANGHESNCAEFGRKWSGLKKARKAELCLVSEMHFWRVKQRAAVSWGEVGENPALALWLQHATI